MNAKELKSLFPIHRKVITISPQASLKEAAALMRENNVHHLVVMKDCQYLGVIDSRHVIHATHGTDWLGAGRPPKVGETLQAHIPPITEETDIKTALKQMLENGVTALALQANGEIIGVVTESDLLKILEQVVEKTHHPVKEVAAVGEAAFIHPLTQSLIKALGDIGI